MGSGGFRQPPEGPKLGPEKKPEELSEAKRQEFGDLAKLVSEPAKLDPRVAAAEPQAKIEDLPAAEGQDNSEEGAARLEVLQHVLEDNQEPELDPEEVAIEEAAEPTIEDRQEFIRCILGNKAYRKSFELFGGVIKLRMADLMPGEVDELFNQLTREHQAGVIKTVDDWNTERDRYRMCWMTEHLMWGDEVLEPHEEARKTIPKLLRSQLNEFMFRFKSTVPYRAMLRVTRIFQRHLDKLTEGAPDSDFWEAGGSDSPFEPTSEEQSTTASSPG